MSNSQTMLKGVVRGRIIELEREPGLPDGQPVTVTVHPTPDSTVRGEGLRRSAGAWADDAAGLEHYLQWNRAQRKLTRGGAGS